jgi:ribosomal protein S6--L-glutamate ligase
MILKSNRELRARYSELRSGDIYIGRVVSKHLKQSMLIDLLERGVHCIPSPLSQTLNASKVAQALILKNLMLPDTRVIARRMDLIEAINHYNESGIGPVVSKENHMHCGHGVRRWESIEALYNATAFSKSAYPFVLQPLLENFTDIRVIFVGDYMEAYVRHNPHNFRMNRSTGAHCDPYLLNRDQELFCRCAMERGKFPFAHLDLQMTPSREIFLAEITLDGGIKGAAITRKALDQKKTQMLEHLASRVQDSRAKNPIPCDAAAL